MKKLRNILITTLILYFIATTIALIVNNSTLTRHILFAADVSIGLIVIAIIAKKYENR